MNSVVINSQLSVTVQFGASAQLAVAFAAQPRPVTVVLPVPAAVSVNFAANKGSNPGGAQPYAAAFIAFEQVAVLSGAQELTLPSPLTDGGGFVLCVNGLRQAVTDYSVADTVLSLSSDLQVIAGDLISLDFYATSSSA